MRGKITILVLALALIGSVGLGVLVGVKDSSAMAHMGYDPGGWDQCTPSEWVTGVIVPANGGVGIKTDDGDVRRLTWGSRNPAVVEWDRRYTIGGHVFTGPDTFWACGGADSVIPQ